MAPGGVGPGGAWGAANSGGSPRGFPGLTGGRDLASLGGSGAPMYIVLRGRPARAALPPAERRAVTLLTLGKTEGVALLHSGAALALASETSAVRGRDGGLGVLWGGGGPEACWGRPWWAWPRVWGLGVWAEKPFRVSPACFVAGLSWDSWGFDSRGRQCAVGGRPGWAWPRVLGVGIELCGWTSHAGSISHPRPCGNVPALEGPGGPWDPWKACRVGESKVPGPVGRGKHDRSPRYGLKRNRSPDDAREAMERERVRRLYRSGLDPVMRVHVPGDASDEQGTVEFLFFEFFRA